MTKRYFFLPALTYDSRRWATLDKDSEAEKMYNEESERFSNKEKSRNITIYETIVAKIIY